MLFGDGELYRLFFRWRSSEAKRGLHGILALEVAKAGRAAKDRSRIARSHPDG
jgi:hypothetical protein